MCRLRRRVRASAPVHVVASCITCVLITKVVWAASSRASVGATSAPVHVVASCANAAVGRYILQIFHRIQPCELQRLCLLRFSSLQGQSTNAQALVSFSIITPFARLMNSQQEFPVIRLTRLPRPGSQSNIRLPACHHKPGRPIPESPSGCHLHISVRGSQRRLWSLWLNAWLGRHHRRRHPGPPSNALVAVSMMPSLFSTRAFLATGPASSAEDVLLARLRFERVSRFI